MAAALARSRGEAAGVGSRRSLSGVGVGSPGDANEKTGTVSAARNIPGWERELRDSVPALAEGRSAQRCGSGTMSRSPTDAEFHLGAGKPYDTILGVFWGTGVGGGLILDGKSWLGRGAAAEIGHMVVKMDGAKCPLRAQGLHGGLRGPRRDGGEGARGDRRTVRKTKLFELVPRSTTRTGLRAASGSGPSTTATSSPRS